MKNTVRFWGVFLCLLLMATRIQAQENTTYDDQLAYNYGVLIGYDFEEINIHYRRIPIRSILQGVSEVQDGKARLSESDAQEAIQTTKNALEGMVTTSNKTGEEVDLSELGYNYGLAIGYNWKTLRIPIKEDNLTAFQEGVKDVFYDAGSVATQEEAQVVINQQYLALHKNEEALQAKKNKAFFERNAINNKVITLESSVQYQVVRNGDGAPIGNTNAKLRLYYIGKLTDGTVFTSVTPPEEPVTVTLDGVMAGWREVLPLMQENQTIMAYIPPQLGYGNQKHDSIPPNSILVYEITLMEVED